ncbi:MAG: HAMP domain-containing histidine kinase, partial [Campylobacteraceae bacterium]|nr:HAMP domain-containing histidine kinase [Campylobacteraceae bacterium]
MDKRTIKQIKLESIGTLVAGITHEINTPLTYMKNNLELLELDLLDSFRSHEGIQESIENLKDGINRISNIVEATNEIVKTGSNHKIEYNIYKTIIHSIRIIHNHTKFQMPIYINDELYTPDFKANRHTFKASIIKDELEQVWIILLNNAYDEFLKSDKLFKDRALNIRIMQEDDKTIISFKDNANHGIDETILDNIFEPFV